MLLVLLKDKKGCKETYHSKITLNKLKIWNTRQKNGKYIIAFLLNILDQLVQNITVISRNQ